MVAQGGWLLWGGAWLLRGACMVALGGMHGCSGGGHAWLLRGGMRGCSRGACVVAPGGACVVALGGMHGCSGGACMVALGACVVAPRGACVVALGGACVVAPGGGHAWDTTRYEDTVHERAVRILLECILVYELFFLSYCINLFGPISSVYFVNCMLLNYCTLNSLMQETRSRNLSIQQDPSLRFTSRIMFVHCSLVQLLSYKE